MTVVEFDRLNPLIEKWWDFTEDMINDMYVSPKDVVELIKEIEEFIKVLKDKDDIKVHL